MQQKLSSEKSAMERSLREELAALRGELDKEEAKTADLTEKLYRLEMQHKAGEQRNQFLESEKIPRDERELETLREQNKELGRAKHENEKKLQEQHCKFVGTCCVFGSLAMRRLHLASSRVCPRA